MDITVKGKCPVGKVFAPTWDMVNQYKNAMMSEAEYTEYYYKLLLDRWNSDYLGFRGIVERLVAMLTGTAGMPPARSMTLVCFCPTGAFCHRHLLVKWLTYNYPNIQYMGERTI